MRIWQVYWRDRRTGLDPAHGYVKAESRDDAYDIAKSMLREGYEVTAVYEATENWITPQSLTMNFRNNTDYFYPYVLPDPPAPDDDTVNEWLEFMEWMDRRTK